MWGEKLHELQISDKKKIEKANEHGHKILSPEIDVLDKEISVLGKDQEKTDELRKKVNLIADQVQGWSNRVTQKIDQQFGENITAYGDDKSLAFIFEKIAEAVCKQLSQIIAEEDDEERGYITAKDFMNDFCTQEFLDKNIRVRPISGVSRGDDGKTNDPYTKGDQADGKDNETAQHNYQILDMEEAREKIKTERKKYMLQKKLEEEKAKKKR